MDLMREYNIKYRWKLAKGVKAKFRRTKNVGSAGEYEKIFGPPPSSSLTIRSRSVKKKSCSRGKLFDRGEPSSIQGSKSIANGRSEKLYAGQTVCEQPKEPFTFAEAEKRTMSDTKAKKTVGENMNVEFSNKSQPEKTREELSEY